MRCEKEKSLNKMLEMLSFVKLGSFNKRNQIGFGWVNLSFMKTCFCVLAHVLIKYIVEKYDD